ncbi:MAG: FtsW/RodA/SpoVE family cell cycle protein [Acidimicrobiales bacterium]|nr:FtsW/RodA/SpoVE family cell cycle protein [Acidimicrobiales bacterium]
MAVLSPPRPTGLNRRPRTTEFGFLVASGLLTAAAFALAAMANRDGTPPDVLPFLGLVLLLLGSAHLVVRRTAPEAEPTLLPLVAALNGLGYVMIARLDEDLAARQSMWTLIGLVAFTITLFAVPRVRKFAEYRYLLAIAGLTLLLLPLLPFLGVTIRGARIWISAGLFTIQPGEFARVVLTMFLAGYLIDKRELLTVSTRRFAGINVPDLRHFAPLLVALSLAILVMVAERDLGSSLLFFALFVVMIYLATSRIAYVLTGVFLFAVGSLIAYQSFGHVRRRVSAWLFTFDDPDDAGYQVAEAAFAMADGGLFGTGIGEGTPNVIPVASTDMIFAAIGEELGLVGAAGVLVAFLLVIGAGFRVALEATDPFEKLVAGGLSALLGFQVLVIVGGVVRLLPLTGVTLPFVSYGGSSLVANYVILALLIRISHSARTDRAEGGTDLTVHGGS